MFKLVRVWAIALLLCVVLPAQTQMPSFFGAAWLKTTNRIAIADRYGINFYTPEMTWLNRLPILKSKIGIIREIRFSPDEKFVAVFADDTSLSGVGDALLIWDLDAQEQRFSVVDQDIEGFAWNPDSQLIAVSQTFWKINRGEITFFKSDTGAIIKRIPRAYEEGVPSDMAWRNNAEIALYDGDIEVWEVNSSSPSKRGTILDNFPNAKVEYAPSGNLLAFVINDYTSTTYSIQIFDARSLQYIRSLIHPQELLNLWWESDYLVSLEWDNVLNIWNATTGAKLVTFNAGFVTSVSWNAEKTQLLLQNNNGETTIRDATTGAVLARLDVNDLPDMP